MIKRFLQGKPSMGDSHKSISKSLHYSWIITNQLAIGAMPRSQQNWEQLEQAGFRSRFSCCYPEEHIFTPMPFKWLSDEIPLPDHREQEKLQIERLENAVVQSLNLMRKQPPLYLHCMAGIERSSLVAVGLIARHHGTDVFTALDWVRRCHPHARPIMEHLEMIDQILKK